MNNRGAVEIILAVGIIALLASSALVLDVGMTAVKRVQLQNAMQNAALSGAHFLTVSDDTARTKALEYVSLNGENPAQATVTISNNSRRIDVSASKQVNFTVARVIGLNSVNVSGRAGAIIGPITSVSSGVRPIGVENLTYTYGQQIVLKENAGDGVYGNFGSIALGGSGNSVYLDNLLNGYNGTVSVGDLIPTEPGNKAGSVNQVKTFLDAHPETFPNYSTNSVRLWTLPLMETYDPNGREPLKVVGFAEFFIESIQIRGGQAEITGRFVQYISVGTVDPNAPITGLYGVQMVR